MTTITIQIGNSDDKLTQEEWSKFVANVADAVRIYARETHFFACSQGDAAWQNAAWIIFLGNQADAQKLKLELTTTREAFKQNSVAWTEGLTQFI